MRTTALQGRGASFRCFQDVSSRATGLSRASVTEPFGYLLKPIEDSQLRTAFEVALSEHAAEIRLRESEQTTSLRQAHARLQLALQGSSVGIWDIDMPDGDIENVRLTFVNLWEQPTVSIESLRGEAVGG